MVEVFHPCASSGVGRMINVSADKRLPFETVKKVIYTSGFAGFPDFRLAVVRSSEERILKDRQQMQQQLQQPTQGR